VITKPAFNSIDFSRRSCLFTLLDHLAHPPEPVWLFSADRLKPPPRPTGFNSLIVSDFPEIFAQLRGKRFSVLWRGTRDGFRARTFHRLCDGHANTLTVILDTDGNVFGSFTPVKWDSSRKKLFGDDKGFFKADDSLRSFLFTLRNPHNIPARRFALRGEWKGRAIRCDSKCGPCFGNDIGVSDNCNANPFNYTFLGLVYTNDTGLAEKMKYFQVKEIEVFEITEMDSPLSYEGQLGRISLRLRGI
jgi:hypothetical protein